MKQFAKHNCQNSCHSRCIRTYWTDLVENCGLSKITKNVTLKLLHRVAKSNIDFIVRVWNSFYNFIKEN